MTAHILAQDAYIARRDRMAGTPIRETRTATQIARPTPDTYEVLKNFTFKPYDFGCWNDAAGKPILRTMEVVAQCDPTSRFLVTYDYVSKSWRCVCPSFRGHWGSTMIDAVQMRLSGHPLALMAAGETIN
jgi:hypothetical protein